MVAAFCADPVTVAATALYCMVPFWANICAEMEAKGILVVVTVVEFAVLSARWVEDAVEDAVAEDVVDAADELLGDLELELDKLEELDEVEVVDGTAEEVEDEDELELDEEVEMLDVVAAAELVEAAELLELLPEDELDVELDPEPLVPEPPASKTTTLAVDPFGMVTTQNSAPPAPSADSELVTSFTALVEGSMEHGRPSHPSPSQIISTPQVGSVLEKSESV